MLGLVQEIVYRVTGKTGITYDTDFIQDLELNSFDIMNVVCAFEDHFHVRIPNRDVWQLHQVRDVIEYMRKRGITEA